jgi:hypothetical protein
MMQNLEKLITDEDRKNVNLENTGLTNEDLNRIVNLVNARKNLISEFNLAGNNINDKGAQILASLKNVRYLNVRVNDISDEGVKYLVKNTPFESLNLSINNLTDKAVEVLLSPSKLTWLNIEKNGISLENKAKIEAHIQQNKLQTPLKEKVVTQSHVLTLSKTQSPLHTMPHILPERPLLKKKNNLERKIEELKTEVHKAQPEKQSLPCFYGSLEILSPLNW